MRPPACSIHSTPRIDVLRDESRFVPRRKSSIVMFSAMIYLMLGVTSRITNCTRLGGGSRRDGVCTGQIRGSYGSDRRPYRLRLGEFAFRRKGVGARRR